MHACPMVPILSSPSTWSLTTRLRPHLWFGRSTEIRLVSLRPSSDSWARVSGFAVVEIWRPSCLTRSGSSSPPRYLVGGPGWSGAGPAAVGTGVLPLSVDDPGAKVTRGSRALVTADKGNDPLCVRSFAGVGAGAGLSTGWPCTHAARGGRRDGYRGHRGLHRYRASARRTTGPRP